MICTTIRLIVQEAQTDQLKQMSDGCEERKRRRSVGFDDGLICYSMELCATCSTCQA